MPVSAYVIRCAPDDENRVRSELAGLPGVEVGEVTGTGFPVATDTPTHRAAVDLGERLERWPGVISAVLVYHNFEDLAEEGAEIPATKH